MEWGGVEWRGSKGLGPGEGRGGMGGMASLQDRLGARQCSTGANIATDTSESGAKNR